MFPPLLSMAKLTGEGGGAGGIPSTRSWESLLVLVWVEVMIAREMSCEYAAKASAVVGGAMEWVRVDIVNVVEW